MFLRQDNKRFHRSFVFYSPNSHQPQAASTLNGEKDNSICKIQDCQYSNKKHLNSEHEECAIMSRLNQIETMFSQ